MKVLVTGSEGFVGRHFVRHFQAEHDVAEVDIVNGDDCRAFFSEWYDGYDLVVHCAAVVGGRATIDGEPLRLMVEDLSIDAELFRWALRTRPKRIVYFSSSAAYPVSIQTKDLHWRLHEAMMLGEPDATYGFVKRVGERLAAEANAVGIKTHVFRPFSGYGTDQALDYPFPAYVGRAARREKPFDVWGDGFSARDWIHIDDIVGAVLAAIEADVFGPVNLCTGRPATFDELANLCMAEAGYSAPIRHLGDAPQGVHWRVGDPTEMLKFYTPKVTLEEGIARALAATR